MSVISSLKSDIISFAHVLIAVCEKCSEMLIDRTFPEIAPTRIGDLERSESSKESREEEYPDAYLLYLFTVDMCCCDAGRVIDHSISLPYDLHTERLDDREKCQDISDFWDIM
jgi:hypothetical protein